MRIVLRIFLAVIIALVIAGPLVYAEEGAGVPRGDPLTLPVVCNHFEELPAGVLLAEHPIELQTNDIERPWYYEHVVQADGMSPPSMQTTYNQEVADSAPRVPVDPQESFSNDQLAIADARGPNLLRRLPRPRHIPRL